MTGDEAVTRLGSDNLLAMGTQPSLDEGPPRELVMPILNAPGASRAVSIGIVGLTAMIALALGPPARSARRGPACTDGSREQVVVPL